MILAPGEASTIAMIKLQNAGNTLYAQIYYIFGSGECLTIPVSITAMQLDSFAMRDFCYLLLSNTNAKDTVVLFTTHSWGKDYRHAYFNTSILFVSVAKAGVRPASKTRV